MRQPPHPQLAVRCICAKVGASVIPKAKNTKRHPGHTGQAFPTTSTLTRVWLVGPELQAGALSRGQVRAEQLSVFIGCCPVAAWKEQEVTWRRGNWTVDSHCKDLVEIPKCRKVIPQPCTAKSLDYLSLCPDCGPQAGWGSGSPPPDSSTPSPVCLRWRFECCSSCTSLSPDCT